MTMNATRGPATMRGGSGSSSGQQRATGTDLPLKCICNLCNCGGHRCADFNLWANGGSGGGVSGDQDQQRYSSLAYSMDGANENGQVMESSHNHTHTHTHRRDEMSPRCDQSHEERYLTGSVARGRATTPGQQGEEHHRRYARSPASTTNGGPLEDEDKKQVEQELLHVLVTRPEIASKPRDNILFEGDMDLRTTFETSYEALARMRLEHWKSHQAEQQQRQRGDLMQASGSKLPHEINGTQHVSDQASAASGKNGAAGEHQLELTRGADAHHDRDNDHAHLHQTGRGGSGGGGGSDGLKGARMIKSPARLRGGDSLVGTGLALGQVQHRDQLLMQQEHREHARDLNSPTAAAAAAAVARGHTGRVSAGGKSQVATRENQAKHRPVVPAQQNREQSSPFVDPDLSPIIVYDANLNRLERVGLRKRSKYRPSTSLRPGGRAGFFGQSLNEEGLRANGQFGLEEKAQAEHEDESHQQATVSPGGEFCLHDGAAGDTSENLNRNRMAGGDRCGRKHNLSHVNRIDHIKQFNLVENTDPHMRAFKDKATLTEGEQTRLGQQQPYKRSDGHHERQQIIDDTVPQAADERNLALAEEAAAVAEIQRVTSLGPDGSHDGGNERDTRTPQAHGSAAAAVGPEAASSTRPSASDYPTTSPLAGTGDRLAASSRQARMQRVCQNQSFNIHENEYPEVRESKLTSCIKIGGRETVDLTRVETNGGPSRLSMTSPQAGGDGLSTITASGRGSGANLFRESPDFILTTTASRRRAADQHHPRQLGGNVEEGASGLGGRVRTKSVSRNSNLHVGFDGEEDLYEQAGHESAASGGECSKCRVLDLGQDFEFVGSKSGHKYFVERHLNVDEAPISEMT